MTNFYIFNGSEFFESFVAEDLDEAIATLENVACFEEIDLDLRDGPTVESNLLCRVLPDRGC